MAEGWSKFAGKYLTFTGRRPFLAVLILILGLVGWVARGYFSKMSPKLSQITTASGSCSPSVTGNNNTVNTNCEPTAPAANNADVELSYVPVGKARSYDPEHPSFIFVVAQTKTGTAYNLKLMSTAESVSSSVAATDPRIWRDFQLRSASLEPTQAAVTLPETHRYWETIPIPQEAQDIRANQRRGHFLYVLATVRWTDKSGRNASKAVLCQYLAANFKSLDKSINKDPPQSHACTTYE